MRQSVGEMSINAIRPSDTVVGPNASAGRATVVSILVGALGQPNGPSMCRVVIFLKCCMTRSVEDGLAIDQELIA